MADMSTRNAASAGIVDHSADQSLTSETAAVLQAAIEQNRRVVLENNPITADHKWCKETPVPAYLIQYVDQGVVQKLPPGTNVHGIFPSGASYWARTAKIEATDETGDDTSFFIKVHQFVHGKNMVSSEFKSMKLLHTVMPEIVAEPLAWGEYTEEADTYFFVCRFCEMSEDIPDLYDFPELLATMHKRGVSPTGEFGMPYVTFSGRNPQYFPPSKSWEECFSKGLDTVFDIEEETHGPNAEMRALREDIMTKVIPRLLRPLQTEGRTLTPRLVHGDLWDGNASVDVSTGVPKIFDGVCFYAHNEYELAPWWAPRHKMTDEYIAEYIKHFPVAEPAEDFNDRGILYRLRFDLHASSLYPGTLRRRGFAMDTMKELLAKFPLGYEGYLKDKGINL